MKIRPVIIYGLLFLLLSGHWAYTQTGQAIIKKNVPDGKHFFYHVTIPLIVKDGDLKGLKLSPTFSNNDSTGEINGFSGFNLFTIGLGKCFFKDTLTIALMDEKKLILVSANPELCEDNISGWYKVSPEDFKILFSSTIKKISFTNRKTGETIAQPVILQDDQAYFLTIKALYETKQIFEQ